MWRERIVVDRRILGGKPVIKGTRIPVYLIVELLASGIHQDALLWEYPQLRPEDIRAALGYAARRQRHEVIPH